MKLYDLPIHELSRMLRRKEITAVEITEAVLRRIEEVEEKVRAFVTVTKELALEEAGKMQRRIEEGESSPLCGIPAAIKDNICTKGIRTTCSSKILENFVPPFDATVIEKLKQAGLVMVGKTNMDEFAMGSSTENSAFFPTRNPWDLERVPGGSSGGSAAAVACGEAIYALGSDTGGSIRQPASFCNIVGLKPTYGLVSRFGLVAFASSLDQIGPMTKDVEDCALVLQVIAGHDPRDSTSAPYSVPDYSQALVPDLRGLRLGLIREYMGEGVEEGVRRVVSEAAERLRELGAEIEEISIPLLEYALAVYYIIAPSEASANLARYDGVKYGLSFRDVQNSWEVMEKTRQYGFGAEVKRRIMLGTYALSAGYYDAYYLKALKVRTLIRREFDRAFERFDALIAPVSPTPPFRLGERIADPLTMYMSDICTIPVNIAGIPGLSVPAGFAGNLPVGLQIMGKPFGEGLLLRIGFAFEQVTDWHKRRPPV